MVVRWGCWITRRRNQQLGPSFPFVHVPLWWKCCCHVSRLCILEGRFLLDKCLYWPPFTSCLPYSFLCILLEWSQGSNRGLRFLVYTFTLHYRFQYYYYLLSSSSIHPYPYLLLLRSAPAFGTCVCVCLCVFVCVCLASCPWCVMIESALLLLFTPFSFLWTSRVRFLQTSEPSTYTIILHTLDQMSVYGKTNETSQIIQTHKFQYTVVIRTYVLNRVKPE